MSKPPGQKSADPGDPDPAVRALPLALALGHRLRLAMDEHLRPTGLTTQQAAVMAIIADLGQPSISEVADVLGTSHQNLRRIADGLARKGFVAITTDPADGRRRLLTLTPHAIAFWAKRSVEDGSVVATWFAPLDRDERALLVDLLERLVGDDR